MARPTKSLADLIADGTFLARRHKGLLADAPMVGDPELRRLQRAFSTATSEVEAQHFAREFEKEVKAGVDTRSDEAEGELAIALKELGRPRSARQVVNFFPRFFVWDDGSPFHLDDWQADLIKEAYRRDRQGRRVYKEILVGIPRGNGKTPLAAGLSLHALLAGAGRPKVFQIAGNATQAMLGVEYAQNWIHDGDLSRWLATSSSQIRRRDGRGALSILKASGASAGRKPRVAIIDEWHEFTTKAQMRNVVAMQTAMAKEEEAFILAITTAGHDKGSQLGLAYDKAFKYPDVKTYREGWLTIARDVENGALMIWYGMPDGFELDLEDDKAVTHAIALANPGSWIVGAGRRELLRILRRSTEPLGWIRENLNGWTKVAGAWVPMGAWMRLVEPDARPPAGADVFVMVDAAHTYDTCAVGWAWLGPDGRVHVDAHIWSVRAGAPAHEYVEDFYDGDEHRCEKFIHQELATRYRVREVVADPNYFGAELRRLGKRFVAAPLFPQSNEMREYVQEFHRALSPASPNRIVHDGKNRQLREHVDGVAGSKTMDGYYQIRKLNEPNPIDGCVAVIGALGRALTAVRLGTGGFQVVDLGSDLDEDEDFEDEAALIAARRRQELEDELEPGDLDDDD